MKQLPDGAVRVLDGGFVKLIDKMGDDAAIVQAARISYGAGTKKVSDDDKLIRYLMRHRHTTPFEMCEIKLLIRCPMDVWRQWIRHRTASVNEYSTRYSEAIDEKMVTGAGEWRLQSGANKQGSSGYLSEEIGKQLTEREAAFHASANYLYTDRLGHGVAREQARKDLPLSTYTEAYWKINLHNLLHFLSLRMDSHAQLEIRQYANAIGDIVKGWVPATWAAFEDYRLGAITLSARDIKVLHHACKWYDTDIVDNKITEVVRPWGWLSADKSGKLSENRERSEFDEKTMKLFGFVTDWTLLFGRIGV